MATTPDTHPDLYRSIILGTTASPGTVTLSGYDRTHNWEDQRPKGSKGENTINHGPKNSGFTATFYLADLEDVGQWDDFQRLISSTVDGPKPQALPAYHPDLVRNKITDVVCQSIGGFVHDGKGGVSVTVKFKEYRPPTPKPAAKAGAAKRKADAQSRPDPNAEAKRELAALVEQARRP
jgi:hypothetical protein